jgi:hypothetical protein
MNDLFVMHVQLQMKPLGYVKSKRRIEMEQKTGTRSKVIKVIIWVIVIVALLGTMHILVNNFDILDALKSIHGQARLQQ